LVWSQSTNIPPTITATGNQAYCPLSEINIVTDFDIVDPDDTEIEALYIQISTGYEFGFDLLTLSGSHPNVITNWNRYRRKAYASRYRVFGSTLCRFNCGSKRRCF
jgi:hypothetical protein